MAVVVVDVVEMSRCNTRALLRGLTTPLSRAWVMIETLLNSDNGGTTLPTSLLAADWSTPTLAPPTRTTLLAILSPDWSPATVAPPTGRRSCWENTATFCSGTHNGAGFLMTLGIPTPHAAELDAWSAGRTESESTGMFGNDDEACKFPAPWGIPTPAAVQVDDWFVPVAPPTGRCMWESTGILGTGTPNGWELPPMLGFPLAVVAADWPEPSRCRSSCESSEFPAVMRGIPTVAGAADAVRG